MTSEDPCLELFPGSRGAIKGIPAFFAFTCLACRSRYLQIFVNEMCVHCQLHIALVAPLCTLCSCVTLHFLPWHSQ